MEVTFYVTVQTSNFIGSILSLVAINVQRKSYIRNIAAGMACRLYCRHGAVFLLQLKRACLPVPGPLCGQQWEGIYIWGSRRSPMYSRNIVSNNPLSIESFIDVKGAQSTNPTPRHIRASVGRDTSYQPTLCAQLLCWRLLSCYIAQTGTSTSSFCSLDTAFHTQPTPCLTLVGFRAWNTSCILGITGYIESFITCLHLMQRVLTYCMISSQ